MTSVACMIVHSIAIPILSVLIECLEWMLSEKHPIPSYLKQDEALYHALEERLFFNFLILRFLSEYNILGKNKMKPFVFLPLAR